MRECDSAVKTYYQKNKDVILNSAKNYYENDKERLRKQARVNTEIYLKKKKNKKRKRISKITVRQKGLDFSQI